MLCVTVSTRGESSQVTPTGVNHFKRERCSYWDCGGVGLI